MVSPEKPFSQEWMDGEFTDILNQMDNVGYRHPHNWDGSADLNIENPSLEVFSSVELLKIPPNFNKNILGNILGLVRIAHKTHYKGVNPRKVALG